MRATKGRNNVENEKSEKSKTDVIASAVMGDMFHSHVNQGKVYVQYVCTELLKHPKFKSDLVVGLACFDYSVLFTFPRGQAMDCYARLFQSFCVRGWLAKELRKVLLDDNLELIDDLRFVYLDELHNGPKIEYMVTFLSSCPELSKQGHTSYVLKVCCLCLWHVISEMPNVSLGSPNRIVARVDLADVIEPLQSYLLSSRWEQNIFLSVEWISSCLEMLADFGDRALQPSYDPWARVDFHGSVCKIMLI